MFLCTVDNFWPERVKGSSLSQKYFILVNIEDIETRMILNCCPYSLAKIDMGLLKNKNYANLFDGNLQIKTDEIEISNNIWNMAAVEVYGNENCDNNSRELE